MLSIVNITPVSPLMPASKRPPACTLCTDWLATSAAMPPECGFHFIQVAQRQSSPTLTTGHTATITTTTPLPAYNPNANQHHRITFPYPFCMLYNTNSSVSAAIPADVIGRSALQLLFQNSLSAKAICTYFHPTPPDRESLTGRIPSETQIQQSWSLRDTTRVTLAHQNAPNRPSRRRRRAGAVLIVVAPTTTTDGCTHPLQQ